MSARLIALTAAAAASAVLFTGMATPAFADANAPGHYCAKYNDVAVRVDPGGAARDNLAKDQTFQVQSITNTYWSYGYKIVNGVHGYVMRQSLYSC